MTNKFILFQSLIVSFFLIGCQVGRRYALAPALSKRMINFALIFIEPIIVLWSVWGLTLHMDLISLPLAGAFTAVLGICSGLALNKYLRLSDKSRATFLIGSCLSNHGYTMGGFLCYILFGEKGLAMSIIFIIYFTPLIFILIFPYARTIGGKEDGEIAETVPLPSFFFNLQNMPLYAMIAAIVLQCAGIARPIASLPLEPLLFLAVGLYYFSLGANFRFHDLKGTFKVNLSLASIKFLIIPAIAFLVLRWIPLDATIKHVILVESIMPVAVYSVVSSVLFDLDSGLAAGMFVVNTTVFVLIILPFVMLGGRLIVGTI